MKKKNLKKNFFSIITVVKNNQDDIGKTIKSILAQSFKNFEYIVIDGKSNDKTQEIINRINNQMDDECKINLSDYVIENIKWEETYKEVLKIYDIINIKLI